MGGLLIQQLVAVKKKKKKGRGEFKPQGHRKDSAWRCRQGWAGCVLGRGLRPPPGPARGRGLLHRASGGSSALLTPWLQSSGLQRCGGCDCVARRQGGHFCGCPGVPAAVILHGSWEGPQSRPCPVHKLTSHPCALLTNTCEHALTRGHVRHTCTHLASRSLHLKSSAGPRKAAVPQNRDFTPTQVCCPARPRPVSSQMGSDTRPSDLSRNTWSSLRLSLDEAGGDAPSPQGGGRPAPDPWLPFLFILLCTQSSHFGTHHLFNVSKGQKFLFSCRVSSSL